MQIIDLYNLFKQSKAETRKGFLNWLIENEYSDKIIRLADKNFKQIKRFQNITLKNNKYFNIKRLILLLFSLLLISFFLFPPFILYFSDNRRVFAGFHFIFSSLNQPITIYTQLLLIEIIGLGMICFMLCKMFDK